jgi:DNA polymerase I-like protein with 3'-5' exonuclease and polymerase domains
MNDTPATGADYVAANELADDQTPRDVLRGCRPAAVVATTSADDAFPRDARGAAQYYIAHGLAPIPVPDRAKAPILTDWPNLRVTRDTLDAYFPAGARINIGLLPGRLGAEAGGEVVVDIDSVEALRAAPYFLPPTGRVGGRRSASNSHRHYMTDNAPAKAHDKFTDPIAITTNEERAVLLEVLSTGSQVIVAPSVHPTGEQYVWQAFGDPACVRIAELLPAVKRLASAALLGRCWHKHKGDRHAAALALAGGLLGSGWSLGDAERFVEAVAVAAGDEEVRDRVRAVKDTQEALDAGKAVTGWTSLARVVGDVVVARVREWLGIRPERPTATAATLPVRVIEAYRPFPVEVLPAPLDEYVRQGALALGCDPAYLALPALAVAAAAVGNTRVLRLKRTWTEPCIIWSVVVGDSGTLKSPAYLLAVSHLFGVQKRLIEAFKQEQVEYAAELERAKDDNGPGAPPEQPELRRVVISDCTIEKVADILEDNPRGVLVARDELAGWLGSFQRYKGSAGGSDLPHWLETFRAGTVVVDRKTGDRRHLFVPRANVSVTGGIQPGVLARALTPEFLDAGLAARLLMAWPTKTPKVWSEAEVAEDVEAAYTGTLDALLALDFDTRDGERVPYVLSLSPDGKAAWVQFYNTWAQEQAAAEGDLAAAYSKLEAYAARFALLHHVIAHVYLDVDDRRPVGIKSIEAGVTLSRWFANEARRIYAILNESDEQRDARRLLEFVRARGGRITVRRLHQSNTRKYRDADQARAALDNLAQAGLGYWTRPQTGPKGGQPAVWFVLNPCTTPNTTYSTDEDDDDGDGVGAQQYPPPPDVNPQNSQENPGTVGSVGRSAGVKGRSSGSEHSPAAGAVVLGTTGVVLDAAGGEDGPVDASPSYVLVTAQTDVPMVARAVGESALVGLDTETTGLDPRADRLRLLTLCCDTTDGGTITYVVDCFAVDPSPLWETLSTVPVVGHNLTFDLQFLARLGFEPGMCHDTMIMSQVLYAGDRSIKSHKLADCCQRELGEAVSKEEQTSDWSGALTPDQLRYAAHDAALTRRLHDALVPKLAEAKLTDTAAIENGAVPAAAWLSSSGVGFDKAAWLALADGAQAETERLAGELDRAAPPRPQGELFGSGWKWDSPQHVAEALRAIGRPVADTDDDTLAALDHPLAVLLRDYRAAQKLATTYGATWLKGSDRGGRVYAGWRQLGANSGRMACSAPNLQNLPRDLRYRRCFVAPPGRVLVKADYSQIELRIAAQVAGEDRMINAYARGEDLHTLTARQILGTTDVTKADRQLAKAVNFGLLYGMGARGFRRYARSHYGVELTEAQAQQYRRAFFTAYPALRRWHNAVGRTQDQPIETRTLAGRRCRNVARFTEKLNLGVQGTGADGLKAALALLWERRAACPGAVPVLAVHDEIVVECAAGTADAAAGWLRQAMLDGMAPLVAPVPVAVAVSVAPTWGG